MKNTIKNILVLLLSIIISFIFIYLFIFFGGSKLFESGDVILKELGVSIIIGTLVFWIIKINKTSYEKIEELETEVANIADSFSKIVSTRIADNVVTDVSSRLKNHVFRETVAGIEIGANEVAQTLTNKAFNNIDSTLKHTEKTILNDLHSFKKESDTTHQKTTSRSNSNNERNTRNAHATRTGLSKACQQRKSRCKEKLDCNFPYCLVRLYWNSAGHCLCSKKCI